MSVTGKSAVLLAGLCLAVVARAQGSFEGVVSYQIDGGNGKMNAFDYTAKGDKYRLDMKGGNAEAQGIAMIYDASTSTSMMLMASRKMYMVSTFTPEKFVKTDSARNGWKITKTGSEVVAGVPCDDYTGTDANGQNKGTTCVAHGMGNWMQFSAKTGPVAQAMGNVSGWRDAMSGGFFPLKMVDQSNGKQTTMIATKVDKHSVDASLFAPPAGYSKMEVPANMMQQLQQMPQQPQH